jgi:hypothetical protein
MAFSLSHSSPFQVFLHRFFLIETTFGSFYIDTCSNGDCVTRFILQNKISTFVFSLTVFKNIDLLTVVIFNLKFLLASIKSLANCKDWSGSRIIIPVIDRVSSVPTPHWLQEKSA